VKAVPDLLDPPDVDVRGKRVVDAVPQAVRRQVGIAQVRDLRERVNPGIGPAGAVRSNSRRRVASRTRLIDFPATVRAFFWICQPL
jgi:hypothetical protein